MATGFQVQSGNEFFLSDCMQPVNDDDETKSINLDDINIDDDACSVVGNEDELNSETEDICSVDVGSNPSGNARKRSKQCQISVKMDCNVVKFILTRKKYSEELREHVSKLHAEIFLVPQESCIKVTKRPGTRSVKEWHKKCISSVKRFCGRFGKDCFSLNEATEDSVRKALLKLGDNLRSTTAYYWIEADKKTLAVICEKSEREDVLKKVRELLQISEEGFQECRITNRRDKNNRRKPSEDDTARKMATVDGPYSNALNLRNDEANILKDGTEVSGDVSNKKPVKQLLKSVKIDNDVVKFLTKRKKCSEELKKKLFPLGAQVIHMNPAIGLIKLKKNDSTLVGNWEKRCEDTVNGFSRSFHKRYFPIDDSIQDSVSEGLPTIQNTVSSSGAACWLDRPKQNLIVVCLKVERSDVEKAVEDFLQKVRIFAKKCFEIEEPVRELVEKSLPKLEEELKSCKVTFEKQTLVVVCLRNEINNVVRKVESFLQRMRRGNVILRIEKLNSKTESLPPLMQTHATSFHSESCASAVTWRNKRDEEAHFGERDRPVKMNPISIKVNNEIMKFVMKNERFSREVTGQLENFNGEIQWKPAIASVTVVQKSEEVFVPNWTELCQSLVTKFFQRFGKKSYEIRQEIKDSVRNGLTSVKESINSSGADCWVTSTKRSLVLVSLKENLPSVLKEVEDFLQKLKEENEKRQEIVKFVDVSSDHIDYLEHTQFLETVKQSHPGISEVILVKSKTRSQIRFVGPQEVVLAAIQQCNEMVKELSVRVLELPTEAMNFVSQRAGLEFIEKCLSDRDIVSVILVESNTSVKIVAKSVEECEKVKECLCNNVHRETIPLPFKSERIFTSRKWDEISKTIKSEELVDLVSGNKRDIMLHGATHLVQTYNKIVRDFIDSQKIESSVMSLETGVSRYLKEKLSAEVERIKADLREEQVKIEIGSGKIDFEGTKDGIVLSKRRIRLLRGEIVTKSKDFASVGVSSLFSNKDGQRNIKGIEAGWNVIIEVARVFHRESIELTSPQLQAVRPDQAYEKSEYLVKQVSTASVDPFDQCNFTTREGLKVSWKYGNIAHERADILVNSATSDLRHPTMVGRVLNSVGGLSFMAACSEHSHIGTGEIATTIGGNLQCDYVIHAVCCGWNPSGKPERTLNSLILKILLECARKSARSVAMPLIGTGKHNFPEDVVLRVMREAFEGFSSMYPSSTLKEIKLVRYDLGKRKHGQTVQVVAHDPRIAKFLVSMAFKLLLYSSVHHGVNVTTRTGRDKARAVPIAKASPRFVSLVAGSGEQGVTLQVYARSSNDIDSAFVEIEKFIKSSVISKKIEDEKAFQVASKHWDELKRLASDGGLRIKCVDAKTVSIEGLTSKVTEAKDRLTDLVSRFTDEERRSNQLSYISQNVQWYYTDIGSREVAYNARLNGVIEVARMEGKAMVEITDPNGYQYDVDFNQMVARNKRNGQAKKLTRKLIGSGTELSLPSSWTHQPESQVVQLVSLSRSSQEYMEVENHFTLRGGQAGQLYMVQRIQNPGLYYAFLAVKKSMRNPNELRLFHGTDAANTDSINVNNFSRSFAGVNGTAYGNGVYFARDASYSIRYARRMHSGTRPTMYMAKVLVGDFTKGAKGMKAPPPKGDPYNPGVRYDSVVDHRSNPSMYIIFQDNQCYPEYLLTLNY